MDEEKEANPGKTGELKLTEDPQLMELSWEEAEITAGDRMMWKRHRELAACPQPFHEEKIRPPHSCHERASISEASIQSLAC